MTKLKFLTGAAALALVFGAGPVFAQTGSQQGKSGTPQGAYGNSSQTQRGTTTDEGTAKSAKSDDQFAMKAAQGGMAEVKLGQLAEEKGSNQAVKDFGRRMVQDHTKADNQLKGIASQENISLPSEIDKADQATYDRLSKLSGDAFDRAYARDMVRDHTKDVSEFQKEAKNGQNETIKNFAAQTTPVLQNHLDQAKQMQEAVNRTSGTTGGNYGGASGSTGNTGTGNSYPSNRTAPGTTSNPQR